MTTSMDTATLRQLDQSHHLHPFTDFGNYAKEGGRIISRAEHIYIYDSDGNAMLDGMSGLWCCNLGYSQKAIVEAVYHQMQELPYYNNFFRCSNQPAVELAAALVRVTPERFNHVFFTNSGSEANDTNIRLVHRYYDLLGKPQKKQIISRHNAYHGSTIAAASLGGMKAMHEQAIGLSYVHHINQPHWFELGTEHSPKDFGVAVARELEEKIDELGEENVAAFIAEPVQGAGGVIVPPESYWPEVQRICDERDILLVADEVVTGFGRLGTMFGSEHYGLEPDLITIAKGLTSAYAPLSGSIVSEKIWKGLEQGTDAMGPIGHGWTYSAHPIGAAAGVANLELIDKLDLVTAAGETGAHFNRALAEALGDHPHVGEVRGEGMIAAVEFVEDRETRAFFDPARKVGPQIAAALLERGVIARAMPQGDILGFAPPFCLTRAEAEEVADKTAAAVRAVLG